MDMEPVDDEVSAEPVLVWETLKPPQSHLHYWARRADRSFSKSFGRLLAKSKLIASEWAALRKMYGPGAVSPMYLAVALGMSKGGASKLVTRLVSKGLAVKKKGLMDKRFKSVFLTRQGREVVTFLAPLETAADREFYRPLGNNRRYRLTTWMTRLVDGIRSRRLDRWVATQLKEVVFPDVDLDAQAKADAKARAESEELSDYCNRVAYAAAIGAPIPEMPRSMSERLARQNH